ncbi:MAG: biotin/lipoyl-binding protein [Breznakibacter sp.]|nr:biotin/lipoyl-binding protein [Breznakibacter sp.]
MSKYKFNINGNSYSAEVISVEDNIAQVEINGSTYQVELDKSIKTSKTPKLVRSNAVPSTDSHPSVAKTSNPGGPKGGGTIKSPLPGVVLNVMVKPGDQVKIGQRLLILEAMKMENNIDADKEGKVVSVAKNKGDSVMEGDVLVVIE